MAAKRLPNDKATERPCADRRRTVFSAPQSGRRASTDCAGSEFLRRDRPRRLQDAVIIDLNVASGRWRSSFVTSRPTARDCAGLWPARRMSRGRR
jgi:hypothetical protein